MPECVCERQEKRRARELVRETCMGSHADHWSRGAGVGGEAIPILGLWRGSLRNGTGLRRVLWCAKWESSTFRLFSVPTVSVAKGSTRFVA